MPAAAIRAVTDAIRARSAPTRDAYLERLSAQRTKGPRRSTLSCGNLAHGFAACAPAEKAELKAGAAPNVGIVSAYNDMLSAHQPFETYPAAIRNAVREAGGVAQFAGGTPAMCDGVTQGQTGMELSLFSRDTIALSTAIALSHDMFDAALCLGVCDKIVPGLVMGALAYGHLPFVFVPAGPMTSGLPNAEKSRVRQLYAEGKLGRADLLEAEAASYHGAGTCTFYGTANSNQMLMEVMGLHLPGASFPNPGSALRDAFTRAAAMRAVELARSGNAAIGEILDERAFVNGIVGLLATGGSTNHTIHLVAMARAAGIVLRWDDFDALSAAVPQLTRIYPNGTADVNHFHAAGGMAFLVRELLSAGLLHGDVRTVAGDSLGAYAREAWLDDGRLSWRDAAAASGDEKVLRPVLHPFDAQGGIRTISGNLGRAVVKVSAVAPAHRRIEAPARVFEGQGELQRAFSQGELTGDFVAVVRFQGPRANGMPELHKLTPLLGVLQDRGQRVALLTDGRMSGASGKVLAAIHLSPEAAAGGVLARVRDGDMVRLDADAGTADVLLDAAILAARPAAVLDPAKNHWGYGRELFSVFRQGVGGAEEGATILPPGPARAARAACPA
ncbi:MAG: phosphogluconate dehydratase [Rhodospirillales bacterium]|nr:phosphogluconate dehydratase [Rhodospirillales bacterium]